LALSVVNLKTAIAKAIEQVTKLEPDEVVMDVSMPVMAIRQIKAKWSQVRVIVLFDGRRRACNPHDARGGAEVFVSKTASLAELSYGLKGALLPEDAQARIWAGDITRPDQ
jgi:DNA-binding NarL/FixJ family response regulator